MPAFTERKSRCDSCNKYRSTYPLGSVGKAFGVRFCQPCARELFGDREIDRLILLRLIKTWRLSKPVPQTQLPMEG
jgi:hypothetical protein